MNTLLLVAITVGGTFGFMIYMRKKLGRQYAHMRASEVAARLGMAVVEGNPAFNLMMQSVQPSVQNTSSAKGFLTQVAAGQVGGTLGEFKLVMAGQPYGARAELVLFCRQDYEPGLTENVTTTWSDLRMTVHARGQVMPFELRLRTEMTGLESRRDERTMPPQSFGNVALDGRYEIASVDPTLPRRIASALGALATTMPYVHITASGSQVSFVMTPASVASASASLEQILHVLVSVAAVFEGQPMPSSLTAMQPAHVAARACSRSGGYV